MSLKWTLLSILALGVREAASEALRKIEGGECHGTR
jgi:hypothetical protein